MEVPPPGINEKNLIFSFNPQYFSVCFLQKRALSKSVISKMQHGDHSHRIYYVITKDFMTFGN